MSAEEFWRNKKVFLTGHTGFKGAWLSLWLQHLGAEVTGYSLMPPTQPNLFEQARVAQGMNSLIGDVCDENGLKQAMQKARPEIVLHMAAQALVRQSYDDPVGTYQTNVMGTVNLLNAVRSISSVKAVVVVTSDKCYENTERMEGYREDATIGGYDPYSNSKGCAELVVSAYRSSFFNPSRYAQHGVAIATARAGNVIGGGDWAADRLIPDFIRGFQNGQTVGVRNPSAIRPWQHVMEPLSGYLLLAQRLVQVGTTYGGAWNFGPIEDDSRPVQWIADKLCTLWGSGATWKQEAHSGPHEAHYLKLNCSKAELQLGWQPVWGLEMALSEIVDWYRAQVVGEDARDITLRQITQHQSFY